MPISPNELAKNMDPNFDKFSFVRYMKNVGRAYRKQATELISVCRTFVQAGEQTPDSDVELGIALELVDDAIRSAADVKNRTRTSEVDKNIETAIEALSHYEMRYHSQDPDSRVKTVRQRMVTAQEKDESSSTILNRLKEGLSLNTTEEEQPEKTTTFEFVLVDTLPPKEQIPVSQALCRRSNIHEVLWNFGRFKDKRRLTLKQNPHFYKVSDLPTSRGAYVNDFKLDPIHDFQNNSEIHPVNDHQHRRPRIYVLTDKPGRLFLNANRNTAQTRAFGNIWRPSKAIIFKDVCGKIEGESIVNPSIPGAPNAWYLEKLPLSQNFLRQAARTRSSPSSTITSPPTDSVVYGSFHDWREPIHRDLITLHTNVRISGSPRGNSIRPLSEFRNDIPSTVPPTAVTQQPSLSQRPRVSTRRLAPPFPMAPLASPSSWPSPTAASPLNNPATPVQAFQTQHSLVASPTDQQARPILTHVQPTVPPLQLPASRFQPSAFIKYMKNSGRVYRNQAITLISLCRTFVQSQEQNPDSDATLRLALEAADVALLAASKVTFMTSTEVDDKFERVIDLLSLYEQDLFLPRGPVSNDHSSRFVHELMATAKEKDRLSSILINSLKDKLQRPEREPMIIVEFLIHKSLADRYPIIVPQVLNKNSDLMEILWNFSRFKDKKSRLTLSQNPHFYAWLPTSPGEYGDNFLAEPIETFHQHARIHVLTDIPGPLGRVFVETGQNTRAFGNVWIPNNAIIFKGVHGRLEGEAIVGAAIKNTDNLRYFEESPLPPAPRWARSSRIQYSSLPFMAAKPRIFTAPVPIQDWREPIRGMLQPLKVSVNIRIMADPPGATDTSPTYSPRSSPIPTGVSSNSDGSLLRIVPSPHTISSGGLVAESINASTSNGYLV